VSDFFRLLAAGPFFFVSAWLLMIFVGVVASDAGIRPFGYLTAIVVTIGLWLTLARRRSERSPGSARAGRKAEGEG
jgi:hypothetical protein